MDNSILQSPEIIGQWKITFVFDTSRAKNSSIDNVETMTDTQVNLLLYQA